MGLHVPDDADHDLEGSNEKSDSLIEDPWLRKIDGDHENSRRFQPGDHVLVRCNQSSWFRGRIKRHERNGVKVWVLVSETLSFIPKELVSTHVVRLEDCDSGNKESFLLRIRCARPSHLFHRNLYERIDLVPIKRYLEEDVNTLPDPKQQEVFVGSNELFSSLHRNTFYPRRPTSTAINFSRNGFEPRLLRATNPFCCGILQAIADGVGKKVDGGILNAEKASCTFEESEQDYITAYNIAQDPNDEENMDQIRENLFNKFLARRTASLQTSTHRDVNISSSSVSTASQQSGLSLESAKLYLASKRDDPLFATLIEKRAGNSAECTRTSEPCTNKDNKDSSEPRSSGFDLKNCYYPSKAGKHSGLYSMVEFLSRAETESSSASRIT